MPTLARFCSITLFLVAASPLAAAEWIQLFNGKDLTGWTPKIRYHDLGDNFGDTFRVEDGLLKVSYDQYPDGFMLFLGTLFAPVEDRDAPGRGFTHRVGDVVTIRSARLGTLRNRVDTSDRVAPWAFGLRALMGNLAARGLLDRRE